MNAKFVCACTLAELNAKGRLLVRGSHRPILVVKDQGHVYAFDNRCPHMGFPLDRGSVEDGILTCHWHHARFDLASGCTFDLWADDVPTCPVEVRGEEVWVKAEFGHSDPAAYWRQQSSQYPAPGETSGAQDRHDLAKHGQALRELFGHRGPQREQGQEDRAQLDKS